MASSEGGSASTSQEDAETSFESANDDAGVSVEPGTEDGAIGGDVESDVQEELRPQGRRRTQRDAVVSDEEWGEEPVRHRGRQKKDEEEEDGESRTPKVGFRGNRASEEDGDVFDENSAFDEEGLNFGLRGDGTSEVGEEARVVTSNSLYDVKRDDEEDVAALLHDQLKKLAEAEITSQDKDEAWLEAPDQAADIDEYGIDRAKIFTPVIVGDEENRQQVLTWLNSGIAPDGTRLYYVPSTTADDKAKEGVPSEFQSWNQSKILPSYIWEWWTGAAGQYQATTTEYPVDYKYEHAAYLLHIGETQFISMNAQIHFNDGTKMPADDPVRGTGIAKIGTGQSKGFWESLCAFCADRIPGTASP